MADIIEVDCLQKSFGSIKAVDGVSFTVEEGTLFSFLGPNGAGKSTSIAILCTLLCADSGEARIAGYRVGSEDNAVRRNIGVVFQDSLLDPLLTVSENLTARASFYGIRGQELKKRCSTVTEILGIGEILRRPYKVLSGGQRRRVDIARALLNTPRILFLDEPTTGLDPQTRIRVWEIIRDLQKEEKLTVFLTTHYLEEASRSDDVAIIDNGKVVARGTPDNLRLNYSSDKLLFIAKDNRVFEKRMLDCGLPFTKKGDTYRIAVKDSSHAMSVLKQNEDIMAGFEVIRGSMDDVFIAITGHTIRDEG
ncbi:ABC transporter ATP-binding protein [Chitinispirillum alkaliphilum]|nr:ABC transporter ATP-binding protein [Chitinispirillum alkaliphilum]